MSGYHNVGHQFGAPMNQQQAPKSTPQQNHKSLVGGLGLRIASNADLLSAGSGELHHRIKQRNWRVLVSIGLILPALAAIIGIVAWTISIEVASGVQPTSFQHGIHQAHQRKYNNNNHHQSQQNHLQPQPQQYQQPRHQYQHQNQYQQQQRQKQVPQPQPIKRSHEQSAGSGPLILTVATKTTTATNKKNF